MNKPTRQTTTVEAELARITAERMRKVSAQISIHYAIRSIEPQTGANRRVQIGLQACTKHVELVRMAWLAPEAKRAVEQHLHDQVVKKAAKKQTKKWVEQVVAQNKPLPKGPSPE